MACECIAGKVTTGYQFSRNGLRGVRTVRPDDLRLSLPLVIMSEYKRVILITGSNAGIGFELVRLLTQRGHVVYMASRIEEVGKESQ